MSDLACGGPDRCIDDLCAGNDRGICGRWSNAALGIADDFGEDEYPSYPDDTKD